MRKLRSLFIFFAFIASVWSCSQFSQSPTSRAWHNLNARFNALSLARKQLAFAEDTLFRIRTEDYSVVLPILPPVDTLQAQQVRASLDDAIRKASIIAERHSNSRYLDEAYNIIGRARMLKGDWVNAAEVFKYNQTNATNTTEKQKALLYLMHIYLLKNDLGAAQEVSKIAQQTGTMTDAVAANYLLQQAALHQQLDEPLISAALLEKALPLLPRGESRGRIHFILGQLLDAQNRADLANKQFESVLQNNPSYDLEFNTKVSQIGTRNGQGSSITAYRAMLDDRKNQDFKDKIYYKIGVAEWRAGSYEKAIGSLSRSAALASSGLQRAAAYQAIADIYYEQLKELELANTYYDSTLAALPEQSPQQALIRRRSNNLSQFIKNLQQLELQDSLQQLAKMPVSAQREVVEKALKEPRTSNKAAMQDMSSGSSTGQSIFSQRWLLYDPVQAAQHKATFTRTFGNRPLEDNWRRREKGSSTGNLSVKIETLTPAQLAEKERLDQEKALARQREKADKFEKEVSQKLSTIPNSAEQLATSQKLKEQALFQLGKLSNLQFNNTADAQRYFNRLMADFPQSPFAPEALYFLSLMSSNQADNAYRTQLIREYPASSFARQLIRGKVDVTTETERQALDTYRMAFNLYSTGNFDGSLQVTTKALTDYLGSSIEDKFAYLRILSLAKGTELMPYRIAIDDFLMSYPSSSFHKTVTELKNALK